MCKSSLGENGKSTYLWRLRHKLYHFKFFLQRLLEMDEFYASLGKNVGQSPALRAVEKYLASLKEADHDMSNISSDAILVS